MKKILSWIRNHILLTIGIVIVIFILVFISIYVHNSTHGGIYGDRCRDHKKYEISSKVKKKVVDKYKEIDEVNSVDIFTKLCTVKIIVNLKDDIDIENIKNKSNEVLSLFTEKELKYYDFSLYVNSDNEESTTYPINVTRHKSEAGFAW